MADNKVVDNGTLTDITFATDEIGGVDYQRVKISVGADGAATDMGTPGDGLLDAPVLPAGTLVWDNAASRWNRLRRPEDGLGVGSAAAAAGMRFNGTTLDMERGNLEGELLASAARTAGTASANQTNYNHRGVLLMVVVTSAGTGTITLQLFEATVSAQLCAGTALAGTGSLLYYPGVLDADVTGDGRSGALPRTWNAYVAKSDGSSWTYSLRYSLIL